MVSTDDKNIQNLVITKSNITAFAKAFYRVNVTGNILQDGHPALLVKVPDMAIANGLADVLNRMAEYQTHRGIPVGQIAHTEPRYGDQGPFVFVRGNTEYLAEITGRLSLRELAHA